MPSHAGTGTEDTVVAPDGTAGKWSDTFVYERPMDDAARVALKFGCDEEVAVASDVAALAGDIKSSHELLCSEHLHCNPTAAGNPRRVVYCTWKGDHDWAHDTSGTSLLFISSLYIYIHICIHMYVSMYVCMYVMYVFVFIYLRGGGFFF